MNTNAKAIDYSDSDLRPDSVSRMSPPPAAGVGFSPEFIADARKGAADEYPRSEVLARRAPPVLQRATFSTSRLLDFASEKELVAQTGHGRKDWPLVILKELVDNAIDACEEVGTAPSITVKVDETGITVRDNGPGLPAETVKRILDFTIRVSNREAYISPTRGAQGNALKTILAIPYVLNGDRGGIQIEAQGTRHVIEMSVDRIRQEPVTQHQISTTKTDVGTSVWVEWAANSASIMQEARPRFLQIAQDYTWINPHLTLTVDWFGEIEKTDPTASAWEHWMPSEQTSPHWYKPAHLDRLVAGYITHDQEAGRVRLVRELIAEFRGLTGTAKQKRVLDATGLARDPLTRLVNGNAIDSNVIKNLLTAMQTNSKPVEPTRLGSIGRIHFATRFAAAGCEMKSFDYRRVMDTTDGVPWIVETAFGWCPKAKSRRLVCGVNWSPGIINPFREIGALGRSLDTVLSKQRADQDEPVIMVLHMVCPRVEYTDRGKSAVVVKS